MELSWGPEIMMMEVELETLKKKNPASDKVNKKAKRYFFVVFLRYARQASVCGYTIFTYTGMPIKVDTLMLHCL